MTKLKSRISNRGLILCVLVACLWLLTQEPTQALTDYVCDTQYTQCYGQTFGDPTGSCLASAEACMTSHVRYSPFPGPICEPSGYEVNSVCLRGHIHYYDLAYPDVPAVFEGCMIADASLGDVNSKGCCEAAAHYYIQLYCPGG